MATPEQYFDLQKLLNMCFLNNDFNGPETGQLMASVNATIQTSDLQIGAVEIKNYNTDDRATVDPEHRLYIRAQDLETLLTAIKDTDGIKKIVDPVLINNTADIKVSLDGELVTLNNAADFKVTMDGEKITVIQDSNIVKTFSNRLSYTGSVTATNLFFETPIQTVPFDVGFVGLNRSLGSESVQFHLELNNGTYIQKLIYTSLGVNGYFTTFYYRAIPMLPSQRLRISTVGVTTSKIEYVINMETHA